MIKLYQTQLLISLIVFLLAIYYFNNTYVFNFFDANHTFLIPRYHSEAIQELAQPIEQFEGVLYNPRIISLILFTVVVTVFHGFFVSIWTRNKSASRIYVVHIAVLSLVVALFYGLHYVFPSSGKLYVVARVCKDYIQGPVSLVLFLLLWRMYYKQG